MRDQPKGLIAAAPRVALNEVTVILILQQFGGVLLLFALLFFLREYLGWSNAVAFFSIGIIVFVTGLLLKVAEVRRLPGLILPGLTGLDCRNNWELGAITAKLLPTR